ncbi:PREDICTED: uncharacterized protein LOC106148875 isoform X2 [Chinchilla lanigera]|uniref:uncharacterized protein LOC106148875 isoform X2 n=1 Tax=Chinchilla lanigera TaxID=34839 RepID=UPI000698A2AE|nr:PREDICTED: uncharacterized protein LOC106148875 isoform X2 [Chinchilla lanigera]
MPLPLAPALGAHRQPRPPCARCTDLRGETAVLPKPKAWRLTAGRVRAACYALCAVPSHRKQADAPPIWRVHTPTLYFHVMFAFSQISVCLPPVLCTSDAAFTDHHTAPTLSAGSLPLPLTPGSQMSCLRRRHFTSRVVAAEDAPGCSPIQDETDSANAQNDCTDSLPALARASVTPRHSWCCPGIVCSRDSQASTLLQKPCIPGSRPAPLPGPM